MTDRLRVMALPCSPPLLQSEARISMVTVTMLATTVARISPATTSSSAKTREAEINATDNKRARAASLDIDECTQNMIG